MCICDIWGNGVRTLELIGYDYQSIEMCSEWTERAKGQVVRYAGEDLRCLV